MKHKIYLILGESGSGKSTIINELCDRYNYTSINSYTTRPMRYQNETGHLFVDDIVYNKHKELGIICGYTKFNGYRYWATFKQLEENTFYIIDQKGIDYLKSIADKNKYELKIIYITTPIYKRIYRMFKRDGIKKTISRVLNDIKMFKNLTYDIKIINNNIDKSVEQINNVIIFDKI